MQQYNNKNKTASTSVSRVDAVSTFGLSGGKSEKNIEMSVRRQRNRVGLTVMSLLQGVGQEAHIKLLGGGQIGINVFRAANRP